MRLGKAMRDGEKMSGDMGVTKADIRKHKKMKHG